MKIQFDDTTSGNDLGNGITSIPLPGYTQESLAHPQASTGVSPTVYQDPTPPPAAPSTFPTVWDAWHRPLPAATPAGGNLRDPGYVDSLINYWGSQPGSNPSLKNDPAYWRSKILSGELGSDENYIIGKFNTPEGAPAGSSSAYGAAPSGYTPPTGANPGGYDDPSSMMYLNQVMERLNQLKQPQDTSIMDLLKSLSMDRIKNLGGAPYTAGEDAAMVTQYRDPLTQARDAAKQQKAEDLSRRGIGPTSGLYNSEMGKIDQGYERGIAQGSNQLAVQAVNEKQRRADQQLQILNSLLGVQNVQTDRTSQRQDQAVSTAMMFPNFDDKRLDMLLRSSGEGAANPSSILGNLTQLGSLNQTGQNNANQLNADSASSWGQMLAYIMSLNQ